MEVTLVPVGELDQDTVHLAARKKPTRLPFPTLSVPPIDIRKVNRG